MCRWDDHGHHSSAQTEGRVVVKIIKKTEASVDFQYVVQTSTFRKAA